MEEGTTWRAISEWIARSSVDLHEKMPFMESQFVEFKAKEKRLNIPWVVETALEYLFAFYNADTPGALFIGVSDDAIVYGQELPNLSGESFPEDPNRVLDKIQSLLASRQRAPDSIMDPARFTTHWKAIPLDRGENLFVLVAWLSRGSASRSAPLQSLLRIGDGDKAVCPLRNGAAVNRLAPRATATLVQGRRQGASVHDRQPESAGADANPGWMQFLHVASVGTSAGPEVRVARSGAEAKSTSETMQVLSVLTASARTSTEEEDSYPSTSTPPSSTGSSGSSTVSAESEKFVPVPDDEPALPLGQHEYVRRVPARPTAAQQHNSFSAAPQRSFPLSPPPAYSPSPPDLKRSAAISTMSDDIMHAAILAVLQSRGPLKCRQICLWIQGLDPRVHKAESADIKFVKRCCYDLEKARKIILFREGSDPEPTFKLP